MQQAFQAQAPPSEILRKNGFPLHHISAFLATLSDDRSRIQAIAQTQTEALTGYFVPGRLEILGKHTDYAGGSSIVCAIDKGFRIYGYKTDGAAIYLHHLDEKKSLSINLSHWSPDPIGWSAYALAVIRRLTSNFGKLSGGHLFFTSDLPQAAGMSSSSAFIISLLMVLSDLNQLQDHPLWVSQIKTKEDLATYASCIENGTSFGSLRGEKGVGTKGGSQDHVAIICSHSGHLNHFSYAPTRFQKALPMPDQFQFVIAHSGVLAEKTGEAQSLYNRAAGLANALVETWNKHEQSQFTHIGALIQSPAFDLYTLWKHLLLKRGKPFSDIALMDRLDHFIVESELVQEAMSALERDQLVAFGRLTFQSQHYAERFLRNQIQETSFLVASAKRLGALAASAFGAGFGGAVWAMVHTFDVPIFLQQWEATYAHTFPNRLAHSQFFPILPGPPVFELPL
ncbi:MAG: hypothetical protein JNN12_07320 [Bacteroidetes Order II. Incertae sedis bacterium]|nr:hypothetical protein [Bacteroidetes Order II. bacterium]